MSLYVWRRMHDIILVFFICLFSKSDAVSKSAGDLTSDQADKQQYSSGEEIDNEYSDDPYHPYNKDEFLLPRIVKGKRKLNPQYNYAGYNAPQSPNQQNNGYNGFPSPKTYGRSRIGSGVSIGTNPRTFNGNIHGSGPNQYGLSNRPNYQEGIGNQGFQGQPYGPPSQSNPGPGNYYPIGKPQGNAAQNKNEYSGAGLSTQKSSGLMKIIPAHLYTQHDTVFYPYQSQQYNYYPGIGQSNPRFKNPSNYPVSGATVANLSLSDSIKLFEKKIAAVKKEQNSARNIKYDIKNDPKHQKGKYQGASASTDEINTEFAALISKNMNEHRNGPAGNSNNSDSNNPNSAINILYGLSNTDPKFAQQAQLQYSDYATLKKEKSQNRLPPQSLNLPSLGDKNGYFQNPVTQNQYLFHQSNLRGQNSNSFNPLRQYSYPMQQNQNRDQQSQNQAQGFNPQYRYPQDVYQSPQFQQPIPRIIQPNSSNKFHNSFPPQKPFNLNQKDPQYALQDPMPGNPDIQNENPIPPSAILPDKNLAPPNINIKNEDPIPPHVEAQNPNPVLQGAEIQKHDPIPIETEQQDHNPIHVNIEKQNQDPIPTDAEPHDDTSLPPTTETQSQDPIPTDNEPQDQNSISPITETQTQDSILSDTEPQDQNTVLPKETQSQDPIPKDAEPPDQIPLPSNAEQQNQNTVPPNVDAPSHQGAVAQDNHPNPQKPADTKPPSEISVKNEKENPQNSAPGRPTPAQLKTTFEIDYDAIPGWYEHEIPQLAVTTEHPDVFTNNPQYDIPAILPDELPPEPETVSIVAQEAKQAMVLNHMGYLTGFFYKLFEITTRKLPDYSRALLAGLGFVVNELVNSGQLSEMGYPAPKALQNGLLAATIYTSEKIKARAQLATVLLINRQSAVPKDVNDIINIMDAGYTVGDGERLLKTLEDVDAFSVPGEKGAIEVAKNIVEGILRPYWTAPRPNIARLFEMVNSALLSRYEFDRRRFDRPNKSVDNQLNLKQVKLNRDAYSKSLEDNKVFHLMTRRFDKQNKSVDNKLKNRFNLKQVKLNRDVYNKSFGDSKVFDIITRRFDKQNKSVDDKLKLRQVKLNRNSYHESFKDNTVFDMITRRFDKQDESRVNKLKNKLNLEQVKLNSDAYRKSFKDNKVFDMMKQLDDVIKKVKSDEAKMLDNYNLKKDKSQFRIAKDVRLGKKYTNHNNSWKRHTHFNQDKKTAPVTLIPRTHKNKSTKQRTEPNLSYKKIHNKKRNRSKKLVNNRSKQQNKKIKRKRNKIRRNIHVLNSKHNKYHKQHNDYNYEKYLRNKYSNNDDLNIRRSNEATFYVTDKMGTEMEKKKITAPKTKKQKKGNAKVESDDDSYDRELRNTKIESKDINYRESKTNIRKALIDKEKSTYLFPISGRRYFNKANNPNNTSIKKKNENNNETSMSNNIIEESTSSYNDEEEELRVMLSDAVRHSDFIFNNYRRTDGTIKVRGKINEVSSYSDEEGHLKKNIYKAFGYDTDLKRN